MNVDKSLINRFVTLKLNAWAGSTWRGYKTALIAFFLFCNFYSMTPFPPTDQVFGLFVAFLSLTFKSPGSISNYVSAVKSVFKYAYNSEYGPPGPHYTLALQGFRRLRQHRVCPADALLPEDMKLLYKFIPFSEIKGKAFWSALLIGFYTFFRCSTLMPKSKSSLGGHLTRADIKSDGDKLLVSLRYSKTRQFNDSLILFPIPKCSDSRFCAFTAWKDLLMCCPLPDTSPAFSWSSDKFYYYNLFSQDIQATAISAGIGKRLRPHSLRRGGASTALKLGISPVLIKLQGDWNSDAWLRYLEVDMCQRLTVSSRLIGSLI
jgi:hypothetical protein